MKNTRALVTFGVILTSILAFKAGLGNLLLVFFVVGAIPGTKYSLPSSIMFVVMTAAMWVVLLNFTKLKDIHATLTDLLAKIGKAH